MKIDIKEIASSNIDDLETWKPARLEEISFPLGLILGEADSLAGDLYYVLVTSPEALRARTNEGACLFGRHLLIVLTYDWSLIRLALEQKIAECEAETWAETTERLRRHFHWEYEDYQETPR